MKKYLETLLQLPNEARRNDSSLFRSQRVK